MDRCQLWGSDDDDHTKYYDSSKQFIVFVSRETSQQAKYVYKQLVLF